MFRSSFVTVLSFTITVVRCNYQPLDSVSGDLLLYDGSDFIMTVTSTLFVDRTLLIEKFINITKPGLGLLIEAPGKYGKSTNLNMIKRFFSLTDNGQGNIQNRKETSNYLLFKNNNLKIYGRRHFYESHFWKYPTIFIDFNLLKVVKTYKDLLERLKTIILRTIEQHKYLEHTVGKKCLTCMALFDKAFNGNINENDIQIILPLLAKCLHKQFKQQVIVLIDNYDAFVESPLYLEDSTSFRLVVNIYDNLLRSRSVERSVVTGVTRSTRLVMDLLPSCVVKADHGVWKYYGLTGHELYHLLQPIYSDEDHREKVITKIVQEYRDDVEDKLDGSDDIRNTQITSVWSVTQYLQSEGRCDIYSYQEYSLG